MMKTLIIAEKPSVARDIAAALGGFQRKSDWLEREDALISSGIGHLVRLEGPAWARDGLDSLPAIPEAFTLTAIPDTETQLKLVGKLMARPDVTTIVNACDAGREGELIFRLIYEYSQARKPVKRMWLQSMISEAIKEAYKGMQAGEKYDALAAAARCRSEADWLVGINGSRGMTALAELLTGQRQLRSVGRVQTPTLGILVHRELEIRHFKPTPYWELHATFGIAAGQYKARWCSQQSVGKESSETGADSRGDEEEYSGFRINDEARAKALLNKCAPVAPSSVVDTSQRTSKAAPRLFDLTTLQREANKRFKFSAKKTLDLAQALYERHKVVTYPRTDSIALPEDYVSKAFAVMQTIAGPASEWASHAQRVLYQGWIKPSKRIFDNSKISDHFAIVPTGVLTTNLDANESKIFDLIVRRFLAAFHPPAEYDSTLRTTLVADETFLARGRVLISPGWLAVYGQAAEDEGAKEAALCKLAAGESASTRGMQVVALQTKPPARFTEATLLQAMETAGKLIENESLREAMKERGLGTPATRASILETLLADKDSKGNSLTPYVLREGKAQHLVSTEKGIEFVQFLEKHGLDALTLPTLTGDWEAKLLQVEKGRAQRAAFMDEIRAFTTQMIETLKGQAKSAPQAVTTDLGAPCPVCKRALSASNRGFTCPCGFSLARVVAARTISDAEARQLFTTGKTDELAGFHSKAKKIDFSAGLQLVNGKAEFYFPPREDTVPAVQSKSVIPCPTCHKPMRLRSSARGNFWGCSGYPDCKTTLPDDNGKPGSRELGTVRMPANEANGAAAVRAAFLKGENGGKCPTCGHGKLQRRAGKNGGFFLGCTKFPACRHFQWDNR